MRSIEANKHLTESANYNLPPGHGLFNSLDHEKATRG